jgi:hypothetical protein
MARSPISLVVKVRGSDMVALSREYSPTNMDTSGSSSSLQLLKNTMETDKNARINSLDVFMIELFSGLSLI